MRTTRMFIAAGAAVALALAAPATASAAPKPTAQQVWSAQVGAPFSLAVSGQRVLVADGGPGVIGQLQPDGSIAPVVTGVPGLAGLAVRGAWMAYGSSVMDDSSEPPVISASGLVRPRPARRHGLRRRPRLRGGHEPRPRQRVRGAVPGGRRHRRADRLPRLRGRRVRRRVAGGRRRRQRPVPGHGRRGHQHGRGAAARAAAADRRGDRHARTHHLRAGRRVLRRTGAHGPSPACTGWPRAARTPCSAAGWGCPGWPRSG